MCKPVMDQYSRIENCKVRFKLQLIREQIINSSRAFHSPSQNFNAGSGTRLPPFYVSFTPFPQVAGSATSKLTTLYQKK